MDDASSDGSWERIVQLSGRLNPRLRFIRMEKNGKKVQAIKRAAEASDADYIFLTDFDSRIVNPEEIPRVIQKFGENPRLAGVSVKLVPDGNSFFSKFQDVEYGISRGIFSRYLNPQGRIRCVPGAAGVWDRKVFLSIMREHSGRHNGDDLESTAIALRDGYSAIYAKDVLVTTMVPQTPRALYAQRKRWELGSLETYDKERAFYTGQAKNLKSRLGHITLLDWYAWLTTIVLPIALLNWILNPPIAFAYLCFEFSLASLFSYVSRNELRSKRELVLVPLFPFYRILSTIPRMAAVYQFITHSKPRPRPIGPVALRSLPAFRSAQRQFQVPMVPAYRSLMIQPVWRLH